MGRACWTFPSKPNGITKVLLGGRGEGQSQRRGCDNGSWVQIEAAAGGQPGLKDTGEPHTLAEARDGSPLELPGGIIPAPSSLQPWKTHFWTSDQNR